MIDYGTDSKCAPERAVFLSGRDEIWIQLEENPRTVFSTLGSYYGHLWFFKSYILLRSLMYVIINSHFYKFDLISCSGAFFFLPICSLLEQMHTTPLLSPLVNVFYKDLDRNVRDSYTETVPCSFLPSLYPTHLAELVDTFVEQVILHFRIRLQTLPNRLQATPWYAVILGSKLLIYLSVGMV